MVKKGWREQGPLGIQGSTGSGQLAHGTKDPPDSVENDL